MTLTDNVRGELVSRSYSRSATPTNVYATQGSVSYDGIQCPASTPTNPTYGSCSLRYRTGAQAAVGQYICAYNGKTAVKANDNIYYDPAGRATGVGAYCGTNGGVIQVLARGYDADNHTTSETCGGANSTDSQGDNTGPTALVCLQNTATYAWGPSGHLAKMNVTGSGVYSLHWDGSTLLYITDASGALVQENVEKLATWTRASNSLTVRDRDYTGAVATQHNATGSDSWLPAGVLLQRLFGGWQQPTAVALYPHVGQFTGNDQSTDSGITRFLVPGEVLGMNHVDGYDDVNLTFQGVRASDPVTGQWTTPDAYAGNAHDPMSQRSYMWNGNNAMAYTDMSGFCVDGVDPGCMGGTVSGIVCNCDRLVV